MHRKLASKALNCRTGSIIDVSCEEAAEKGQNYASDIRRVKAKFSTHSGCIVEDVSMIVKRAIPHLPVKNFTREISIMSNLLEKMNNVFEGECRLTPHVFDYQAEFPEYLIIEDLKPLGYQVKNRLESLDWEQNKLAIDVIAKFHAASVSELEKEPQLITKWSEGIIDTLDETYVRDKIQALSALMQTWGDVSQKYAAKVMSLSETLYNRALQVTQPKNYGFNVLFHGDYTSRNMLFKYDPSGFPTDLKIIDFQFCQYTSPAVDLWYFFATSVFDDITPEQVEELIIEYHRKLSTTMRAVCTESKVMTLQELKDDMRDHALLYFFYTCLTLSWNLIDSRKIKPIKELFSDIQKHPEIFYNKKFYRIFQKRLIIFEGMGLFDY